MKFFGQPGSVLLLSGNLLACLAFHNRPCDLYLHLIAAGEYPQPPRPLASVPVHFGRSFDVLTREHEHLTGCIEPRGGKFDVRFQVLLYDGTNFYEGQLALDERDNPGTRPYNRDTPYLYQPLFILSSNSSAKPFLKRQAQAEREWWQRENPLTRKQLALVEQNLIRIRPGMTQREVFELLGLSKREKQLHPPIFGRPSWYRQSYQLRGKEVLALNFDPATVPFGKTNWITFGKDRLANAEPKGDYSRSVVVRAQLGTQIWSKE
jgi:hypothetical protein